MAGKRFTTEQWRAWFEEFERSDLTVDRFCKAKGTTTNTFYLWRRKLGLGSVRKPSKKRAKKHFEKQFNASPSSTSTTASTSSGFVSVTTVDSVENCVEFELTCGTKARVANDGQSLRPILEVLFRLGADS